MARCTVERLTCAQGLQGVRGRKRLRTTIAADAASPAMDRVNRQFRAERPNQLWVSDFNYVSTWQRWNGSPGSAISTCTHPSLISRRPRLRKTTTTYSAHPPVRLFYFNQTASAKTEAIHPAIRRKVRDRGIGMCHDIILVHIESPRFFLTFRAPMRSHSCRWHRQIARACPTGRPTNGRPARFNSA